MPSASLWRKWSPCSTTPPTVEEENYEEIARPRIAGSARPGRVLVSPAVVGDRVVGFRVIGFRVARDFLFGGLASLFPEAWGAVVLQIGYIAVCWAFLYFLHRKGVYLKV